MLLVAVLAVVCPLAHAAAGDGVNRQEEKDFLRYDSLNSNDGENPIRQFIDEHAFRVRTCSENNVSRPGNVCGQTTVDAHESIMAKWDVGGTAYLIDRRGYFLTAGHVTHKDVKSGEVVVDDLKSWLQCSRDGGGTEKPQKNIDLFEGKIELVGYDAGDFGIAAEEVAVHYDKMQGKYDISIIHMAKGEADANAYRIGDTKTELLFYPAADHDKFYNRSVFAGFPFHVIKNANVTATAISGAILDPHPAIPGTEPVREIPRWANEKCRDKDAKEVPQGKLATDCFGAAIYEGYSGSALMYVTPQGNDIAGVYGVAQGGRDLAEERNDKDAAQNSSKRKGAGALYCGPMIESGAMSQTECEKLVIVTRLNHPTTWRLLASIPPTDTMCGYIQSLLKGNVNFDKLKHYVKGDTITPLDQLALLNFLIAPDDKKSQNWFYSADFSAENAAFSVRTDKNILDAFCKEIQVSGTQGESWSEKQFTSLFNNKSRLSKNFVNWAEGIKYAYARECANHQSVAIARAGAVTLRPVEAVFAEAGDELLKGIDALEKYPPLARDPMFAGPETESLLDYAVRRFDEAERLIGSRPPDDADGDGWRRYIGAYEAYADIEALDARTARQWGARSAFMSYLQAYRASALYLQAKRDGNEEDRQRSLALVAQSLERAPENEIALSLAADMFADSG